MYHIYNFDKVFRGIYCKYFLQCNSTSLYDLMENCHWLWDNRHHKSPPRMTSHLFSPLIKHQIRNWNPFTLFMTGIQAGYK